MQYPAVKVTLLDGSIREFNSYDYYGERASLILHSHNDQPAYINYYENGSIYNQVWYKEGKRHRDNDLPAYISYYRDGSIYCQRWYKEDKKVTEEEAKKLNACSNGHDYKEVGGMYPCTMCARCYKVKED